MAEYSSFFKSIAGDRKYTADEFAEYFRNFLTNGIKNGGTNLEVEEKTPNSMGVQVKAGQALIQGYYYNNTATFPLTIAAADSVNPRIDRVVLKLNATDAVRAINLAVKTGTPAASPTAPTLQTDFSTSGIYEISLAQIAVGIGVTTITNANITDERLDESVCGLINSLIQVDTATFQSEWDNWFTSKTAEPGGEFYDEWKAWFDAISALLPSSAELVSVDDTDFDNIEGSNVQEVLEDIDDKIGINTLTEKTTPVDDDVVVIEDSEDSFAKKKVKRSNLGPAYITQSKSSTYTALITDDLIFCTGTWTLTLPAASTWVKPLTVKNTGTGIITIDANSTETIDEELTRILTEQMYVVLMSDGTNIHRIGG